MDNIFVERLWRSLKYEEVYLNAYASVAEARPASVPGSAFITRSASIKAWAIAHHVRPTKQKADGYVDDRLRRPAAPSPTSPTGTTANHRIDVDEEDYRSDLVTVAPAAIGASVKIGGVTP